MDLKVIARSQKAHKFIFCITDEVTNYLITVPIYQAKSEEIGEALNRKCYNKVLHSRVYNHRSRHYIYVFTRDLLIK